MIEVLEFTDFDNFHVKVPSDSESGKFHIVSRVAGINYCSDCKGFRYWGYCHHFSDLFQDPILVPLRDKVNELLGRRKIESKEVDVEGWKGKDLVNIIESGDSFIIIEHRKVKSSGEIMTQKSRVKKDNVFRLWRLLNDMRKRYGRNDFKASEIFAELIAARDIKITVDAFNGGRNRARYYFPYYYRPLKCLEWYYFAVEHNDKTTKLIKLRLSE